MQLSTNKKGNNGASSIGQVPTSVTVCDMTNFDLGRECAIKWSLGSYSTTSLSSFCPMVPCCILGDVQMGWWSAWRVYPHANRLCTPLGSLLPGA